MTSNQDMFANYDDEYKSKSRNIASNVYEIKLVNIDPVTDELTPSKQLYNCEECVAVFKSKKGLLPHIRSKHEGIVYSCQHKATQQSHLKHEGVKYSCNQCKYKATTQRSLKVHQESVHEGVKYLCNQCEYQATQQGSLKRHQESVHDGVIYSCNQCGYRATQ